MDTIWVLGDQLVADGGALRGISPRDARVLMIEAESALNARPFHRQRLHHVLASMRTFATELERGGYEVDYRREPSYRSGVQGHRAQHGNPVIRVMEPSSWDMEQLMAELEVELVRSDRFLCHREEFASWAQGRTRLVMEDFYRWQRQRLGYLMDGDEPVGGRWNYDEQNRAPAPSDATWPPPVRSPLDAIDEGVLADLPAGAFGAPPDGTWATSRSEALDRLDRFIDERLPGFGPHQDAMVDGVWSMRHSLLSPYLNAGLLHPAEVCDAAEDAYRSGRVPIASAEGFIRQVIGWREFVWGVYWLWMPAYRDSNELAANRPLPPVYTSGETDMRCVASALESVHDHAYAHHIQRLMVLGNLALLAGVRPDHMVTWMRSSFIDAGDWVMQPNVIGMGLHADGGMMATKPYAAGGNYINRMSDHCSHCRFDPKKRTGEDACPFTTLYWDFLDRNQERLAANRRISRQLGGARRLSDMPAVRERAVTVLGMLDRGEL